jgi:hypothetical protein
MPSSDRPVRLGDRTVGTGTNGYNLTAAQVNGAVHVRMRSQKNGKSHCLVELTPEWAIALGQHLIAMGEAATEKEETACG